MEEYMCGQDLGDPKDGEFIMNDTISRQAAIDLLKKWSDGYAYIETETESAIKAFQQLPSEQTDRKKGKWVLDENPHDGDCRCSACYMAIDAMHERNHGLLNALTGGKWWTFYKFCPNCGAEMDMREE
jgi:NADH pyrophosphatase NudC (nudix superfamily)